MTVFKAVILFALMCFTSSSFTEQPGGGLADSDYPVTVPGQVLKQLINIRDGKGLLSLRRSSLDLTDENLLKAEVRSILHACS